jgi:methylglutaconyl-CoA hydratase
MMDYHTILVTQNEAVASVTLNRPELRNAFNEAMIAELAHAFDKLGETPSVRAIVLAGNGPAFCAGADLNWMKKMAGYSHEENYTDARTLADMLCTIYECPKPVVARVHGDCYAGGMGLVSACDMIVASPNVNFCLSEVKLGLIPATISPYVIKAMGEQMARRYFLTAERFSAIEAHRFGMVHELAGLDSIDDVIDALTKTLAANGPLAVGHAKQLIRDVAGEHIDLATLDDVASRIAGIRASEEGREGVASFLEKRRPGWLS